MTPDQKITEAREAASEKRLTKQRGENIGRLLQDRDCYERALREIAEGESEPWRRRNMEAVLIARKALEPSDPADA